MLHNAFQQVYRSTTHLDAYSEPSQTSEMQFFVKIVKNFPQRAPSQMFNRVLNIPLLSLNVLQFLLEFSFLYYQELLNFTDRKLENHSK